MQVFILRKYLNKILNPCKILNVKLCHSETSTKSTSCKKPLINICCKCALITGGTEGMGFAIAHEILAQEARSVALIGNDTCIGRSSVNMLNCTYGRNKAIFIKTDVQCPVQLSECFKTVKQEFGKIDIIVNAAGILNGTYWEREISTNLLATIRSTNLGFQNMGLDCSGCGGVILNIAGTYGLEPLGPVPTLAASYYGIVGFSKSFGETRNFIRTGVRVVCLCPGITNTNFLKCIESKVTNPQMSRDLEMELQKVPRQNSDVCGKAGIHVILYGESGTVWAVEGSKLYRLCDNYNWKDNAILERQYI